MLSGEDNVLLTRVGPGTPMGEVFRRFWLPALLSEEIAEADSPPLRLRLLSEDLLGFRDTSGRVGIIEPYCAHRHAYLFWGRNEECGLRCTYHGWKYDVDGNCVDMPNEPSESNFKAKIGLRSYPTRERGGVVWVYMGPRDRMPAELPQLEWMRAPEGYRHIAKWLQRTNWCQGMEGEIDSSHTSWLHGGRGPQWRPERADTASGEGQRARSRDGAPRLTLREAPYGFTSGSRRSAGEGLYHWRLTRWLYPFYSLIPAQSGTLGSDGTNGRCWVPIDDEHTWTFGYQCRDDRPYSEADMTEINRGLHFPPRLVRGTYTLRDGSVIDTWLPVANKDNNYLIDRELQRYGNFTGILGVNEQDRSIQESMGRIVDRSSEHLGMSDTAIIEARRLLIRMAQDLQGGIEPAIVRNPEAYHLRAIDVLTDIEDLEGVIERFNPELGAARI